MPPSVNQYQISTMTQFCIKKRNTKTQYIRKYRIYYIWNGGM